MGIGVVVLDDGDEDALERQLAALDSQSRAPEEVVVVGSRTGLPPKALVAGPRAVYLSQAVRSEPTWRNAGAAATTADVVAYCSSRDTVGPQWVEALSAAAAEAELVGGWYARYDPDDPNPAVKAELPSFNGFRTWAYGQNLAVRRDVLAALGGWNEAYRAGHGDVDLCFRAQIAGYRLAYAPGAVVVQAREPLARFARRRVALGMMDAKLWADFGAHGFPARPLRASAREWALLVRRLPVLVRGSWLSRRHWLRDLLESVGRVAGSSKYRVTYL